MTFTGNSVYARSPATALSTQLDAMGGGAYVPSGTTVTMTDITFVRNSVRVTGGSQAASSKVGGGGLFLEAGSLNFYSCNFTANYASGWRVRIELGRCSVSEGG